jgi:hypothetical protein
LAVAGRGRTNRLGFVEIRSIHPGNYTLKIAHTDYADGLFEALIEARGGPNDLGTLELDATASTSGQVVDRYGGTVARAEVAAGDPPAWRSAVRTDAEGRFRVKGLPPGEITVTARAEGQQSPAVEASLLAGEEAGGLVLRLPTDGTDDTAAEDRPRSSSQHDSSQHDPEPDQADPGSTQDEPDREASPSLAQGVAVALSYSAGAIRIQQVLGPAARKAGLREGDVLEAVDGERVLAAAQARSLLRGPPGRPARLQVVRGGTSVTLRVPRERFGPAAP